MSEQKIPVWFWVVAALCLVWNLLGVMAFFGQVTMTEETLAKLPEAEQALYAAVPAWVNVAFGCAVFGGALGCLGLLLRKRWAVPLLGISLLGVLAQMSYNIFIAKSYEVYGPGPGLLMPAMVLAIACLLLWFGMSSRQKGWLT